MADNSQATNISTILLNVGLYTDVNDIIMDYTEFCEDCKGASFEFESYDQQWHCYQCENKVALDSLSYQDVLDIKYFEQGTYDQLCRGHSWCPYDCCN